MSNLPPSERVIRAVSETTGRDPLELPPLFETVEGDALDAVVRSMERGTVTFEYADRTITVDEDGTVAVEGVRVDAPAGTDDATDAERASSV